jgi:Deuterolysin metalloprotease (M35) family
MRSCSVVLLHIAALSLGSATATSNFFDSSDAIQLQIARSPLQIQLRHVEGSEDKDSIQAVIANRGSVAAFFSTSENPLSKEDEQKVHVFNEQNEPIEFLSPGGFITSLSSVSSDYEKIPAGESITRKIEISSKYALNAGEKYFIEAAGFVKFYVENQQESETQNVAYETNALPFVAPNNLPAALTEVNRLLQDLAASSYLYQGCSDTKLAPKLNESIPLAVEMSEKAAAAALTGTDRTAFVTWFKADTPQNRKVVSERYTAIAEALSSSKGPVKISCSSTGTCAKGVAGAFTSVNTGDSVFCAVSNFMPVKVTRCNRATLPGVVIHELSHSAVVYRPSTCDCAQGTQSKTLSEARAIVNADTFNMYAQAVYLGQNC